MKFNTGATQRRLGMSYVQFAMQGLRHQMSQGAANWTIDPGDRFTFYRLVDSVVPRPMDKLGTKRTSSTESIPPAKRLPARLDATRSKIPQVSISN